MGHSMDANRALGFTTRQKRVCQNEASVRQTVAGAIGDYLRWMKSEGYAHSTQDGYRRILKRFSRFIEERKIGWESIFTLDTLESFQRATRLRYVAAVRGLSRYLFAQGTIRCAIGRKKDPPLPQIYQDYLNYYHLSRHVSRTQLNTAKRGLFALNDYLQRTNIKLTQIRIEHIDAFLKAFNAPYALTTRRLHRSHLRGFLRYLHYERNISSKDLAPLVVGPPMFAKSKPPQFLRPHQVKQLFDSLKLSSAKDLRNYAMIHLAYFLGLRPHEISQITLDDISFKKAQLALKNRKNNREVQLPLPENVLKAIMAYIVGARPKSKYRTLFLSLMAPHAPICAGVVGRYLTGCLCNAGLSGTAYWLRHTYAQNMLEAGAEIFEIKEMLGHDSIESSRKYLYVHTELMREVLLDETL